MGSNIDPKLLRAYYWNWSGADPSANPTYVDIARMVQSAPILPVVPYNNTNNPLNCNVTNTSLPISSILPTPGASQTIVQKGGVTAIGGGSDQTLYTTTSGKKLYITAIWFSEETGTSTVIKFDDNATGANSPALFLVGGVATGDSKEMILTFPSPMVFPNKLVVNGSGGATNTAWGFSGWEQ